MRVTIPVDEATIDALLPPAKPDGSRLGINYADQLLKLFKLTLPDGRKLSARRRGLRITIVIGDRSGEAILRRIEHGPDVRTILGQALAAAAHDAGAALIREPGAVHLEL
jgi:hypothetical protein